jgi:oxygen-independent coproporphyrinogen-3 oxidase
VHIPFCRALCPFCPYNKVIYSQELADAYTRCLQVEAGQALRGLEGCGISTVYFGGGTPATLPNAIESLVELMNPHLMPGAGVAVELHPRDADLRTVLWLKRVGVTMVSLGVESLQEDVLKSLGRGHDSRLALAALEAVMAGGFDTVNVDLMTGIPGQTLDEASSDFARLLKSGVGQVSAYPLMDFPFTRPASSLSLWDQRRLLAALAHIGGDAGYERSSVWTWTRPGSPKYTSVTRERFAGIGAGAATYLDGYFALNTFDVGAYIDSILAEKPPVALHTFLGPKQSALYWLFWRCYEGRIDLSAPELSSIASFPRVVRLARTLGLAEGASQIVQLTDAGLFLYHLVERYYTRAYIGRLWQACRESAFPPALVL